MEEWRAIPGYEGIYEVSDHGKVRSLDRLNSRGHWIAGAPRRLVPTSEGYLQLKLHRDGEGKMHRVHSLVLSAFVGPRPDGCEAAHADGSRDNNRLDNLRWATRSSNQHERARHGTSNRGRRNHTSRLTQIDVRAIRSLLSAGYAQAQIAAAFGVSGNAVWEIAHGRSWSWLR